MLMCNGAHYSAQFCVTGEVREHNIDVSIHAQAGSHACKRLSGHSFHKGERDPLLTDSFVFLWSGFVLCDIRRLEASQESIHERDGMQRRLCHGIGAKVVLSHSRTTQQLAL